MVFMLSVLSCPTLSPLILYISMCTKIKVIKQSHSTEKSINDELSGDVVCKIINSNDPVQFLRNMMYVQEINS